MKDLIVLIPFALAIVAALVMEWHLDRCACPPRGGEKRKGRRENGRKPLGEAVVRRIFHVN